MHNVITSMSNQHFGIKLSLDCCPPRAAVGGWIGSEIGKTMERYDPEENKWEVIGSMAVPRYYFGCCELQGVYFTHISYSRV